MRSTLLTWTVLVTMAVATAACGADDDAASVPAAQSEAATTRASADPTTVTGCLRAGEAEATFVLTTAQTVDGLPPTTYHLTGATGVNLQDHVGQRVEVSGVVDEQSHIATRQAAQPAENAGGSGSTGSTPTVQTGTQLSIKRLDVTTIKGLGGACEI